jgi:hypothetical protein
MLPFFTCETSYSLQEHVLEKRCAQFLKVLERGGGYLKDELLNRNLATNEAIQKMKKEVQTTDLDFTTSSDW